MFMLKIIHRNAHCNSCGCNIYSECTHNFDTIDLLKEWIEIHPDPNAEYRIIEYSGMILWENPVRHN